MEEGNVTVLVDAKEEYTKQLISILKACIYQGIKSIYMDAKDICNQDNTPDNVLMVFQDLLSRIPKWSQDIINKEFERITNVSKCDYIDDLLKVVYVTHIKILTIVHSAQKNKKLSLKVPSGSHFIHLCYIECAREFWKDPYYFSDRVTKYEHQKNMRDSESMIAECIMETIRKQLPVRHILKEFLNEPDEEIEEEDEDIKEPSKKKYLKKLESVVKKELKTSSKNGDISDINIELIRQVIREEMNSRPGTDVIKKELVDTVVEKIIDIREPLLEELEKPLEKLNIIDLIGNSDNKIEPNIINEDKLEEKAEEMKAEEMKAEVKTEVKAKEKAEVKAEVKEKIKTSQSSLENLLNDNEDNDIDNDIDNEIDNDIDIDNNIEVDDKVDDKVDKKSKLVINNIDEVNLNLDELDDEFEVDLDNEIDLNQIQNTNVNKKDNSDKIDSIKEKDTKYIFFKDV